MPFTFAHPAAAIPLHRRLGRFGVLSALAIGSLTPDLPYFLPLPVDRMESHSLAGLFWFCLPLGLSVYLVFHLLLKRPLLVLLPNALTCRIAPLACTNSPLPNAPWAGVMVSLLAGAATHLVWDSFTHERAPGVQILPFLRIYLFSVGEYHVHLFQVLQHASSVIGVGLLAWWSWRWLRSAPPHPLKPPLILSAQSKAVVVVCLLGLSGSFALVSASDILSNSINMPVIRQALRQAVITAVSTFGIGTLAYSIAWHIWSHLPQQSASAQPGRK